MSVDLHCHSTYSDGSLSPKELIERAKQLGLRGLSITDHDTFSAFFEAENQGIDLLPGIELSTVFEQSSIHILGYAFDPNDRAFSDFCFRQRAWRLERNRQIIERLCREGLQVSEADLINRGDPNRTIGRVHIALALLQKGYVKNFHEAFKRYIGSKCSCFVPGMRCTTLEGIEAIHKARGLAVLAHPHLINSRSLVRRLLELPFDGLEAYYGRHLPNVNRHWEEVAKNRGLFATGGSDFHGLPKPEVPLGAATTPIEVFEQLKSHYHELSNPS